MTITERPAILDPLKFKEARSDFMIRYGLTPPEIVNLQRVIEKMFRVGPFLNFAQVPEADLVFLSGKTRKLLESYRQHIEEFGQDSIAHLCPPPLLFRRLTGGICLIGYEREFLEVVKVDTISQLRGLKERLDNDVTLRPYPKYKGGYVPWWRRDRLDLSGIFSKLSEFEAMTASSGVGPENFRD